MKRKNPKALLSEYLASILDLERAALLFADGGVPALAWGRTSLHGPSQDRRARRGIRTVAEPYLHGMLESSTVGAVSPPFAHHPPVALSKMNMEKLA
jgi:hypothetical protein